MVDFRQFYSTHTHTHVENKRDEEEREREQCLHASTANTLHTIVVLYTSTVQRTLLGVALKRTRIF